MNHEEETVGEALETLIGRGLIEAVEQDGERCFRITKLGLELVDEMGLLPETLKRNLH